MTSSAKQERYKGFLERKYKRLIEEAYNVEYTDHGLSDILTFEALRLYQKMQFLKF